MPKLFLQKITSFSSFSWILICIFVSNNLFDSNYLNVFFCLFIMVFLSVFARIVLWMWNKKRNEDCAFDTLTIQSIQPAEFDFWPIYMGLYIIGFEFKLTWIRLIFLIFLFVIWVGYFESAGFFNPFFLFFNYRFYKCTDNNWNVYILITKEKDIKNNSRCFKNLLRINNFTFLDGENKNADNKTPN